MSTPQKVWYSVHLTAGTPERIIRAANERNMSPGEFIEHAVELTLTRGHPHHYSIPPLTFREAAARAKVDEFVLAYG